MNEYQGSRILVVDDNAQNRSLVDATLADEEYEVVLAASGVEALESFAHRAADCVLLDVRMPGMDGFEVCRRIRALPTGAETPVVFLTALREVEVFDEALKAGGDDFLTKPVRPAELLIRVRAALELRRLNAENRGYFTTIREQRDAVMRLQLQKEQLTAFLVHDLKNPVNALDMQAQLLLRDKALSARSVQAARAIRQEARRLTQLITNMLDINRGDAGELCVKRVRAPIASLFEALSEEFSVRAAEKDVTLVARVETEAMHADVDLMRRVLENLLDNAIRHAPSGTKVTLTASSAGDGLTICVADEGGGVPEAIRKTIFERFVQAGQTSSGSHRYGLGLAFCKLVVVAHGGDIWVESEGRGATFWVRLPHAR